MKRHEILQKLFGYQSDEDEAKLKQELNRQANSGSDTGPEPLLENEGIVPNEEEAEVDRRGAQDIRRRRPGSSRSPDNGKDKDPAVVTATAALLRDVFGDSGDDEPEEDAADNKPNLENRSQKYKGNYAEESQVEKTILDKDAINEREEEHPEHELKEKRDAPLLVFEIPLRRPPVHRDQTATVKVSNIIGIDRKPFDPATYVEDDLYVVDDSTGSKRLIPHANIIRWREVKNPDGTTSVESNARFITWSDGSLQLLIGNEIFDVSEQDAREIESHVFIKHEKGIFQSQGKIPRKMRFMPTSLSSNTHRRLAALVESRHKKVNKVRQYITDVDPETVMEQTERVERQTTKAMKQQNEKKKKKKVTDKYGLKDSKGHQLTPGFLEDAIDKDNEQSYYDAPNAATLPPFDLDLEAESAAEKRIMNAKKGPKHAQKSTSASVRLTKGKGPLHLSKGKVEMEQGFKGKEVEPYDAQEGEEDAPYVDSDFETEDPEGKGKESGSNRKKQYIESDEDTPEKKTATRRQVAVIYDSSEE